MATNDDIVVDKRPSDGSNYDVVSVLVAVTWDQESVMKLWKQPQRLRGRDVTLQVAAHSAETTLRLMDYMGRVPGKHGSGGRGYLSFLSRVYRVAGFQSWLVGRVFRKQINGQLGGVIEMVESEEMRKAEGSQSTRPQWTAITRPWRGRPPSRITR